MSSLIKTYNLDDFTIDLAFPSAISALKYTNSNTYITSLLLNLGSFYEVLFFSLALNKLDQIWDDLRSLFHIERTHMPSCW